MLASLNRHHLLRRAPTPALPRTRGREPVVRSLPRARGREPVVRILPRARERSCKVKAPSPACGEGWDGGERRHPGTIEQASQRSMLASLNRHHLLRFSPTPTLPRERGREPGSRILPRARKRGCKVKAPSPACGGRLGWGRTKTSGIHRAGVTTLDACLAQPTSPVPVSPHPNPPPQAGEGAWVAVLPRARNRSGKVKAPSPRAGKVGMGANEDSGYPSSRRHNARCLPRSTDITCSGFPLAWFGTPHRAFPGRDFRPDVMT
jgi:hypothetical protein